MTRARGPGEQALHDVLSRLDMVPNPCPKIQIFSTLCDRFSEEELRTLCFFLEVDYNSLPADGKAGKARELVLHYLDDLETLTTQMYIINPRLEPI